MAIRTISLVFLMLCGNNTLAVELRAAPANTSSMSSPHNSAACLFVLPANIAESARCSTTWFPTDYTDSKSRSAISLHAVTVPGTHSSNTATILLDGGPGGSGNAVLHLLTDTELTQGLLALGDIVVLAQRGTRFSSQPLDCSGSHEDCIRTLQQTGNIESFTTENSARDIISFADDASYTGIRILAYSYGTRLALQIASQAPDRVLSMALDSVIPLKTNHQDLRGIDDALVALDRACDNSGDCKAHVPDSVIESFLIALASLEQRPIVVPGALGSIRLTPQVFVERVVNGIQAGNTLKYMPRFIAEISSSRVGLISRDLLNGPGIGVSSGSGDLAVGLLMAVNCSDIPNVYDHRIEQTIDNLQSHTSDERAMAGTEILRKLLTDSVREQGSRCDTLPGRDTPVLAAATDPSRLFDGPTLLLSGEFDPIAPLENATQVQQQLGQNSQSLLFPAISHAVAFESGCARAMITSFFKDAKVRLEQGCIDDMQIDFPAGNGFMVTR